jgi:hypothetical protein
MNMNGIFDHPMLILALSFSALWLSTWVGASILRKKRSLDDDVREDFSTILVSTLTLNGLIIGFSFSMAISRYDQRKVYEETEANAISTEYVRADLLPAAAAERARSLLRSYLDQRILFYRARGGQELLEINARTAQLESELWTTVREVGVAQQTPIVALAVAGMNDVLNAQGYTRAAWWNRIPSGAWALMVSIAIVGNLLVGYGVKNLKAESVLLGVLPFVFSVSFLLIGDIDSPRGGVIRVTPQNLVHLAESIRPPPSRAYGAGAAALKDAP